MTALSRKKKTVNKRKNTQEQPSILWLPGLGDKEGQRTYEQKERYIRKDKSKKDKAQEKSREVVTVPYVHSFTEKIQRMFTKHRVATVVSTLNHPQTGFSSPEGQS